MSEWISTKDISDGIMGFPKLSITTQANLRARKKITYTVIASRVFYKREWIEDYINSNTKEAQTSKEEE